MSFEDILKEIRERPAMPLWPHAGAAYGLSRSATYKAAKDGQIETVEFGRVKRAITKPLRQRLQMDAA